MFVGISQYFTKTIYFSWICTNRAFTSMVSEYVYKLNERASPNLISMSHALILNKQLIGPKGPLIYNKHAKRPPTNPNYPRGDVGGRLRAFFKPYDLISLLWQITTTFPAL